MRKYKIQVTKKAELQLTELRNYIAETLNEKDTAAKYLDTIEKAVFSLDEMPMRYPVVENEPHRSRGLRRMLIKNFYIYYSVDDDKSFVYIQAVVYARRDQYSALE